MESMMPVLAAAQPAKKDLAVSEFAPSTIVRELKVAAAFLLPAFLALLTLMYGNEWLGRIFHSTITLQSPGVYVFQLGGASLKWYGLFILIGFFVASFAFTRSARWWGLTADDALGFALWALVCGGIGARLYYVAICFPHFAQHPERILSTWLGGLTIHGCMLGTIFAAWVYGKFKGKSFFSLGDMIVTSLPLAQGIWRLGNFFNSEAYGMPLSQEALVKLFVAPPYRPVYFAQNSYFHPAFLYELLWDLLLFAVFYFVLAKKLRTFPGVLSAVFILSYSAGRLVIEWLRVDGIAYSGIVVPIVVTESCLLFGTALLLLLIKRYAKPISTDGATT
ncbi:MAG TPA: prolipoprotein diacylglyceryl transferase [Candidatus Obscuribacterales bacterium]